MLASYLIEIAVSKVTVLKMLTFYRKCYKVAPNFVGNAPSLMRMDRRIEIILETLAQPTRRGDTPGRLAPLVNLSVSRTRHLFKREVGVSLGRFLRARHMEMVKRLLMDSFLSVKEIMAATGFAEADETSFIREFKKTFGVTPGQFRRLSMPGRQPRSLNLVLRKEA
ncbi:MAG: AraC family transcriptional regulator [Acidobacteriota bacterium]|nr:AraC family transcriptional regulator [Acidobacteriota bacterium]